MTEGRGLYPRRQRWLVAVACSLILHMAMLVVLSSRGGWGIGKDARRGAPLSLSVAAPPATRLSSTVQATFLPEHQSRLPLTRLKADGEVVMVAAAVPMEKVASELSIARRTERARVKPLVQPLSPGLPAIVQDHAKRQPPAQPSLTESDALSRLPRHKTEPRVPRPKTYIRDIPASPPDEVQTTVATIPPRKLPGNPVPRFPPGLIFSGHGGEVLLAAEISASGRVSGVAVLRSSGIDALDLSAQAAVARWRYEPARRGEQAIAYRLEVPIRFTVRR